MGLTRSNRFTARFLDQSVLSGTRRPHAAAADEECQQNPCRSCYDPLGTRVCAHGHRLCTYSDRIRESSALDQGCRSSGRDSRFNMPMRRAARPTTSLRWAIQSSSPCKASSCASTPSQTLSWYLLSVPLSWIICSDQPLGVSNMDNVGRKVLHHHSFPLQHGWCWK